MSYRNAFLLIVAALAAFLQPLSAMSLQREGTTLFATGRVIDDVRAFEEALAQGGIETVVFVNSPGGELRSGLIIGRLIAEKKLKTAVAGYCISACSLMFVGGVERRFTDTFRPASTSLGIHGAHSNATGQTDPAIQPQLFAHYQRFLGDKFNSEVMNLALYQMDDRSSLLTVREATRNTRAVSFHCRSARVPRAECTQLPAHNGMSLGLLTHADLLRVNVPKTMLPTPRFAGVDLTAAVADTQAAIDQIKQQSCATDACKSLKLSWEDTTDHKAIAANTSGPGFAYVSGRSSTQSAALNAIYACNHRANQPVTLCQARLVDEFAIQPVYAAIATQHEQALAKVTVPSDAYYGQEEFGGTRVNMPGFKTGVMHEMTPSAIDGVQTIATKALAEMVAKREVTVVDVLAGPATIPGALALAGGGQAFTDPAAEAAFAARFAALLKLLAPDTSRPIAFACLNRECWLSVNAALRAKQLGYAKVLWYRGGIESWQRAGLAVAPSRIEAVAN